MSGGVGTPCEQLSPTQGGAGVVVGGGLVGPEVVVVPVGTGGRTVHELDLEHGSLLAGSGIPTLQS